MSSSEAETFTTPPAATKGANRLKWTPKEVIG